MCGVRVEAGYADVAQEEMLLIPGLAQERDVGGLAHCARSSVAANQVASLDLLVLARLPDLQDNALRVLGEAHQLRVQFHLPAIRRQSCTQHGLSMFLANHQDGMIGRRHWREERGRVGLAYEFVMVIGACRRHAFIIGQKGIKHTQILKDLLSAEAEAPAARPDLVRRRLLNNTAADATTTEITGEPEAPSTPPCYGHIST